MALPVETTRADDRADWGAQCFLGLPRTEVREAHDDGGHARLTSSFSGGHSRADLGARGQAFLSIAAQGLEDSLFRSCDVGAALVAMMLTKDRTVVS